MTSNDLLRDIESAARKLGLAPSTMCRLAVNNGDLPRRLRSGKTVSLETASRLTAWIDSALSANRRKSA